MEGEWSYYRGGHSWRENGHVTQVVSLMEGEWLLQGCLYNGEGMVILEVVSLTEGEWSLRRWPV